MLSSTQYAGSWVRLDAMFPGVNMDYSTARFAVTFDSRGTSGDAATTFNPVVVTGKDGKQATLRVTTVGAIRVQ
jgi:hypothetical protein